MGDDTTERMMAIVDATQARLEAAEARVKELEREREEMLEALAFYADPETYFAIGMFPDPPCGQFMEDWSDCGDLGEKPGKRARETLLALLAATAKGGDDVER